MSGRLEDITVQRLEKLQRLRSSGINPYPNTYHRSHTTQEAKDTFDQGVISVSLAGRVVAQRSMGKAIFIDIRDGSGKIQAYFRKEELSGEKLSLVQDIDIGDFIGVKGDLFRTRSGEITLKVADVIMLAKSLQPLPEKWHGLVDVEKRYRQRYLDLISNQQTREIFVMRSGVISSMRRFLDKRGFIEVETPVLQSSAGGAMAKPFITHHNVLDQDLYLRIATELHLKRLIVGGFDKVYEIGRIFRNEGISTRHNPEFTTLESYEAYADYNDIMSGLENMVCHIVQEVTGKTKLEYGKELLDFSPPWKRIVLREAIAERCGIDIEDYPEADSLRDRMSEIGIKSEPNKGRGKLIDDLLSAFVEPTLIQPTFILDYPVELSPLAKKKPDNPRLVERFEAYAGCMEIANAFTELNDPIDQRERFQQQVKEREAGDEEAELPDEDFLLALEYGMPPTGGLGVGIDRLVMLIANQQSIREVILFPQLKTK